MGDDLIDSVWAAMTDNELYSAEDLANASQQPTGVVSRVLEFLTKYGFTEKLVKHQPLYRKLVDSRDPAESLTYLQRIVSNRDLQDVEIST